MQTIMVWGWRIPRLTPGITPGNWVMQILDSRPYQHGQNSNDDHSLLLEAFSNLEHIQKRLRDGRLEILRDLQETLSTLVREIYTDNITRRIFKDSSGTRLITGDRKIRNRSVCNLLGITE